MLPLTWKPLGVKMSIDDFLAVMPYSDSTSQSYRWMLDRFVAAVAEPQEMTPREFREWLDSHKTWGGNMRHVAYCAVRAYIKWAFGASHPALTLSVKRPRTGPQRTMTDEEAAAIHGLFDTSGNGQRGKKGIRDLAIFSLALDTGLRSREICNLQTKHVHLSVDYPQDPSYVEALTKGGDWDARVISIYTTYDIGTWLSIRDGIAVPGVTACFVGVGGNTPGRPLTPDGLRAIVRKWGVRADLEAVISPHVFKRTGACLAAEEGAGDQLLMRQFGWKSKEMPRRYTQKLTSREFVRYSPVARLREK